MKGHEVHALPTDDVPSEHVRVTPQGPLGPPAPRGPRVEPRGARAGHNRALRVAQAVPGGEAHRTKMSDARAERAPGALTGPTDPWGTLGARVIAAKRARAARSSEGLKVYVVRESSSLRSKRSSTVCHKANASSTQRGWGAAGTHRVSASSIKCPPHLSKILGTTITRGILHRFAP